jgi:hypothetical protein
MGDASRARVLVDPALADLQERRDFVNREELVEINWRWFGSWYCRTSEGRVLWHVHLLGADRSGQPLQRITGRAA